MAAERWPSCRANEPDELAELARPLRLRSPPDAPRAPTRRSDIDSEHVESALPELDRTDDPRGGAVAWALLAVGGTLVAGILLAVMWAAGAW